MRNGILHLAAIAVLACGASLAYGQDANAERPSPPTESDQTAREKPNLMSQLGLSNDQMRQIRRLNQERKPRAEAAQRRLREANRSLDAAIYADVTNEADIDARVKELQAAQSEMIALRSASEVAIRKILSPEQLLRFRDLRAKFELAKQERQQTRKALRSGRNAAPGMAPKQGRRPI